MYHIAILDDERKEAEHFIESSEETSCMSKQWEEAPAFIPQREHLKAEKV